MDKSDAEPALPTDIAEEGEVDPIGFPQLDQNVPWECLPEKGLLFSEYVTFKERFCKPKLIPLKSVTLQKIEDMERKANEVETYRRLTGKTSIY